LRFNLVYFVNKYLMKIVIMSIIGKVVCSCHKNYLLALHYKMLSTKRLSIFYKEVISEKIRI
jgi:hypothetical protein